MKMNQILSAALISTAMTTAAMAEHGKMTGFYVGVNGGYGVGHSDTKTVPASAFLTKVTYSMNGFVGGLHGGYQKDFGCMVAGLELAANLSNNKGKDTNFNPTLSFKRKNAFGAAARLGFKANSWLVYGKLGYESAKFSVTQLAGTSSKRHNAFVPGLGMETMLTNNVMFGGEWTYAMHGKKNYDVLKPTSTSKLSLKPRFSDFKLRLGYKF